MEVESFFYKKLLSYNKVECMLCSRRCIIPENEFGFCKTQKNINGKLYIVDYGKISSYNIDPVEKKPLYHFYPGSNTFSVGSFSCNMSCLNCQNYTLSQNNGNNFKGNNILPERLAEIAIDYGCLSIAWTYNEPTLQLQYAFDTAQFTKNYNLKNIFVTNGFMSEESLDYILPYIDAFNVDLKSMNNRFYEKICNAELDSILDNIKKIYKNGNHIELTNLIIPKFNSSNDNLETLIEFIINELGKEVPIHFSRFFPYYKMTDINITPKEILFNAKKMAENKGLDYVYIGNISENQNTYCPHCGELLIERDGYKINNKNKIKNNKCINCNYKLNFILD